MNILHIDSGLFPEQSLTRKLSSRLVSHLQSLHPESTLTYRDLAINPPAHLDATILMAAGKPEAERNLHEAQELALSQTLRDEVFAADALVIAAPMYNFTIPSQLKAWLDRVLQAGVTFRYTEKGPEGLVTGKQAYIVSSRGGVYSEGPASAMEFQESLLLTLLGFIGISDVQIIRTEGVAMGDDMRNKAVAQAEASIAAL